MLFITLPKSESLFQALEINSETSDFIMKEVRSFEIPDNSRISRSDSLELYKSSLENKVINEMRSIKSYYRKLEYTDLTPQEQKIARISGSLGAGTSMCSDFFVQKVSAQSKVVPKVVAINKTHEKQIKREAKARAGKPGRVMSQAEKDNVSKFHKGKKYGGGPGRTKGVENSVKKFNSKPHQRIVIIDLLGNIQGREYRGQIHTTLPALGISRKRYDEAKYRKRDLGIRDYPFFCETVDWTSVIQTKKKMYYSGWRIYLLSEFMQITNINPYDDYTDSELKLNLKVFFKMTNKSKKVLSLMGREPYRNVNEKKIPLIYDNGKYRPEDFDPDEV